MTARTAAWGIWCVWALLAGLGVLLQVETTEGFPGALIPAIAMGSFVTVGAIVVSRQPHNLVGWVCCGAGFLNGVQGFAVEYARYALGRPPGSLPGGLAMAWLGSWLGGPSVGLALTFVPLLFPTGRLPSQRWRLVAWACAIGLITWCVVSAVRPGPMAAVPGQPRNPLGIESAAATLERTAALLELGLALFVVLCATSVVVRYRQARGVERQQLKWFAYGAGQLAVLLASAIAFPELWDEVPILLSDLIFGVSFAMIPVAIGIAILRYRLYDIDRLINRTLVYGLLTAMLAAVYAVVVLALGQVFGGIGTEPPSWAVAGATLAVAALFQPARRRIQQVVDRHFNRRKYNAAKTVEAFSARLRDEVDLDALAAELLAVVDQTMQPTRASLWLQPSAETSPGAKGKKASHPHAP